MLESNNAESMAVAALQMALAGVNVNRVPVLDVSPGKGEETAEKLKR